MNLRYSVFWFSWQFCFLMTLIVRVSGFASAFTCSFQIHLPNVRLLLLPRSSWNSSSFAMAVKKASATLLCPPIEARWLVLMISCGGSRLCCFASFENQVIGPGSKDPKSTWKCLHLLRPLVADLRRFSWLSPPAFIWPLSFASFHFDLDWVRVWCLYAFYLLSHPTNSMISDC